MLIIITINYDSKTFEESPQYEVARILTNLSTDIVQNKNKMKGGMDIVKS